jgi:2-polyprenyl-3-methyl-5-hydroxy-6-metoxy-1,4-benzoquinol methylase
MDPADLDPRNAWNAGAEAYIHFVDSGADYYRRLVHAPALLAACGDVRGLAVLDLGCAHGDFSRRLATAGASVTGVDLSDSLLAAAVAREAADPLGITYLCADVTKPVDRLGDASFDLVTAAMSLQDTADPGAALAEAARVLRPAGRLVFSVPHPCTTPAVRMWQRDDAARKLALCLDRYFDTGPAVCEWNMARLKYPWRTPYQRLTLEEWSDRIYKAGFTVQRLREPRPNAALVADCPDLDDCYRMPFFLIFDAAKAGGDRSP